MAKYPERPGYARGSDTSRAAADSIDDMRLSNLHRQVVEFVRSQGDHGATAEESEHALDLRHQTVSARIRELMLGGRLFDAGKRRLASSGRYVRVLTVTKPNGEVEVVGDDGSSKSKEGQLLLI